MGRRASTSQRQSSIINELQERVMRRFVALFAVFWLALTVQAQAHTTPISHKLHKRLTKTLPSCVLACIETAAQIADCPSDDTACLCESEGFLGGFASCLNRHCDEQADKDAGVDIGETVRALQACCGSRELMTMASSTVA